METAQAQHGTPRSNKGTSAKKYPTTLSDRPIKLIVAGSRGWCCSYHPRNDHSTCVECRSYARSLGTLIGYAVGSDLSQVHLIHGDCKFSPDVVAEAWAKANNVPFTAMPAEWDHYGKSAGARRNTKMAERATHLVAVWDGSSNGTRNMIEQAKKLGLRVQKFSPPDSRPRNNRWPHTNSPESPVPPAAESAPPTAAATLAGRAALIQASAAPLISRPPQQQGPPRKSQARGPGQPVA